MKKIVVLVILINGFVQGLVAQNKTVDSLLNWIKNHPKIDSQYIITLHRISWRSVDENLKQSFAYYDKVSYYSDSMHFLFGKGLAQVNLGVLFNKSANFDASNKAFFSAIGYADSCGDLRLKSTSLNNIGENFKTLKDFAKCRQYAREAIDVNIKIERWIGVGINYELLQQCDLEEKLYDSAKSNLLRGLPYAVLSRDSSLIMQYYLGFGKLYAINNQADSALYYFNYAINESKRNDHPLNEYEGYMAQVHYLRNIGTNEKLSLLKKALRIASETKSLEKISNTAHEMSFAYDEKNDRDSSAAFYKIYRTTADSLFSENNRRNVVIKETEWMVKRQEIENAHLKEFTQLQDKELAIKNGLLLAVLLSLLLIIVVAFFIYKSIQSSKRNTESLLKQNIAEKQMQVLRSQMNPHFIFNSLNSIDAFIQSNDKYNATMYLGKFAKLMRNVLDSSKQHIVTFSKDIETLKLYIEMEEQRSEKKFITELLIDEELMNSDYKVPPLIIQPFVENAIIHGLRNKSDNRGVLCVNISKTDSQIVYTITDNGIGMAASSQIHTGKGNSYGLEMSYERVKLFNKEVAPSVQITDLYENKKATGTKIQVKLNIV
ncbi:MAG: histidine kinase [Bacteroidota bacterium]